MIKKQLLKLKENWLLIAIFLVAIIFVSGTNSAFTTFDNLGMAKSVMMETSSMPMFDQGFAPEIEARKVTETISLNSEIKRGTYSENEQQLKSILSSTNSLIVNENVNTYDGTKSGYYQIKVDSDKSEAVLTQLQKIGEVTSFNTNKDDITNSYNNNQINLEAEQERLNRYKEMYSEAKDVNDKIQLTNLIFNQERTIKYLQDGLNNKDQKVDYTTISFSMQEKQSEWTNIAFTTFGNLVRSLVDSVNTLLTLLFVILPYAVIALIAWLVYRKFN